MNQRLWVLLLSIAAFVSAGVVKGRAQTLMTRHVREVTLNGQAKVLGRLPATQIMQLDVVLPLRDQAGLDAFLAELYNPSSLGYRQYLTPAEFTERFGPTQQDYDAVVQYVQNYGLAVVGGSRDGMEVQVKGDGFGHRVGLPREPADLPASRRESRFLRARPRAHYGPALPALAHLGAGQLLHPASDVRQEERLCYGTWHQSG